MSNGNHLKYNLLANFAGRIWVGLIGVACASVYIPLLGIEAYGLIGLDTGVIALIGVLGLGLTTALNRELARLSARTRETQAALDLVRTLEIVYWTITLGAPRSAYPVKTVTSKICERMELECNLEPPTC